MTTMEDPRRPRGRSVTMADVAAAAGVSRASVSRVFLGQKKVSEDTRRKVFDVAERLGYVPNVMASELASNTSKTVGLLLRDAANPAYGQMFTELQKAAQVANISLVSMTVNIDRQDTEQLNSLRHLIGMRVAGLIVATGSVPSEKLEPFANQLPIIRAGRPEPTHGINAVSYDEVHSGTALASYVFDQGHRDVAVMRTAKETSFPEFTRAEAMKLRLEELGARPIVIDIDHNRNGHFELRELLDSDRVTAAMSPTDLRLLNLIRELEAQGISVPDDISLTGCDGLLPGSDLLGITTYRLPVERLAQEVIANVQRLLNTPDCPLVNLSLKGELIPGQSVLKNRK